MSEKMTEAIDKADLNRETALIEYELRLSKSDIVEKAQYMADLQAEILQLESDKSVKMAEFSSKIKERTAQIANGLKVIKTGFETVEEECTFKFIWDEGIVEYYSCNTGECVSTREITKEERQMKLFDEKKTVNQSGKDGGVTGNHPDEEEE